MKISTVIILMVVLGSFLEHAISITSENYFHINPPRPLFGDTVNVSCRMVAPKGFSFYRTEPEVAFDEDAELQRPPSQIGVRNIEGVDTQRFSTYRSPDGDRTNVSLIIEIRNFSVTDVGLKISCISKLHIQQNFRDEKIVVSGVLQNAAPPPSPTNVLVRPPHSPLTCQSRLIVTWDNVPDNRTLTDEPVERYNVSVNVGGVQFVTVCSGNNPILVNLQFGSYNSQIQAEVCSMNRAGVSSPAVSNVMEIYRPEIVNLTVRVYQELSLIYLSWKFKTNNPDWLLDISYSLVVTFRESVNGSERIFKTNFTFSSDITNYILRTNLATDKIESVTLTRIKICNQLVKDQNHSLTYHQNNTQNPTQVVIQNTHVVHQNVSQVITQNVTQVIPQGATDITTQNTTKVITTRVPNTHTNKLPNYNSTVGTSNDILSRLKRLNFEHSYVVILVLIGFILLLTVIVVIVVIVCFIRKCVRGKRPIAGVGVPVDP